MTHLYFFGEKVFSLFYGSEAAEPVNELFAEQPSHFHVVQFVERRLEVAGVVGYLD